MTSPDKLFGNLFTDPEITTTRLANCAQDTLNRLIAANNATPPVNDFTAIINALTKPVATLQQQVSGVDTSVTHQRGATQTNDEVMTAFRNTMRTQEGVIANSVGGFKSTGYIQFYPHGLSEYTKGGKEQMPTLVKRVNTAALTFATQLGEPLATNLQNFATQWQNSRDAQQQQIGVVGSNRTGRTQAETDVQLAMLFAIHSIALMFPADVAQCSSFFDFSLLYPQAHPHKSEILNGTVIKNTAVVALNRSFTVNTHLKLTTEADNASLLAYVGATADAPSNGKGVEVKANDSRNLKLSEMGDANNTFLIIKNLSDVNDAGYVLEVKN